MMLHDHYDFSTDSSVKQENNFACISNLQKHSKCLLMFDPNKLWVYELLTETKLQILQCYLTYVCSCPCNWTCEMFKLTAGD